MQCSADRWRWLCKTTRARERERTRSDNARNSRRTKTTKMSRRVVRSLLSQMKVVVICWRRRSAPETQSVVLCWWRAFCVICLIGWLRHAFRFVLSLFSLRDTGFPFLKSTLYLFVCCNTVFWWIDWALKRNSTRKNRVWNRSSTQLFLKNWFVFLCLSFVRSIFVIK